MTERSPQVLSTMGLFDAEPIDVVWRPSPETVVRPVSLARKDLFGPGVGFATGDRA